jgi:hypothetical protein
MLTYSLFIFCYSLFMCCGCYLVKTHFSRDTMLTFIQFVDNCELCLLHACLAPLGSICTLSRVLLLNSSSLDFFLLHRALATFFCHLFHGVNMASSVVYV